MKIQKVVLNNFRGYKSETFTFTDGLNTLIGSGDNGKSAMLKAVDWVSSNFSKGNYISDWIKTPKGDIKTNESCWVELHTFDGDVIRRERSKTENKYTINGVDLFNLDRNKAPAEVDEILNISNVNAQSQFSSHFMISDTASVVAKTLNKIVDLEIIDESIANINKLARKVKKDKEASDNNIETYQGKLEKFTFIDQMEEDINEYEKCINEKGILSSEIERLTEETKSFSTMIDQWKDASDIFKHEDTLNSLVDVLNKHEDLMRGCSSLKEMCEEYDSKRASQGGIEELLDQEDIVITLISLIEKEKVMRTEANLINDLLCDIDEASDELERVSKVAQVDCSPLLKVMEENEKLEKEFEELDNLYNTYYDLKNELADKNRDIESLSVSIEGQACPTCGQSIGGSV